MKYVFNFSDYKVILENAKIEEFNEEAKLHMKNMLWRISNTEQVNSNERSSIVANYVKFHIDMLLRRNFIASFNEEIHMKSIYSNSVVYLNKHIGDESVIRRILGFYNIDVVFIDCNISCF